MLKDILILIIIPLTLGLTIAFGSSYLKNKKMKKLKQSDKIDDRIKYYTNLYSYMPPTSFLSPGKRNK